MVRASVPELTHSADIKLNQRLLLRRCKDQIRWPAAVLQQAADFMIRYLSNAPSKQTKLPCSVETEYRELMDLRERVREAETAAAMRLRPQKGNRPDVRRSTAGGEKPGLHIRSVTGGMPDEFWPVRSNPARATRRQRSKL